MKSQISSIDLHFLVEEMQSYGGEQRLFENPYGCVIVDRWHSSMALLVSENQGYLSQMVIDSYVEDMSKEFSDGRMNLKDGDEPLDALSSYMGDDVHEIPLVDYEPYEVVFDIKMD